MPTKAVPKLAKKTASPAESKTENPKADTANNATSESIADQNQLTTVAKMPSIEMPAIDPKPSENFFAEFEQDAKNLKWRYILFGIFALILAGVMFLLKPRIESWLFPKPPLEQTYSPVSEEPKSMSLEINNPDDELLTFDKSLVISGKTTPKSTVIVSNGNSNWAATASEEGNFSQVINLTAGINSITIFAFDPQGTNKTASRTIYYSTQQL